MRHGSELRRGAQPLVERLDADALGIDAGAVVAHLDDDLAPLVVGAQGQDALGCLAGRDPLDGGLQPVVDGVADQVGERVLHRLQQRPVELGLTTLHAQGDLLAALRTEVAHDARQLRPEVVDGLHARLHHALLQLGGDQVQALGGPDEFLVLLLAGLAHDLVASEHQLTDQSHECVKELDVDADRGVGDAASRRTRLLGLGVRLHQDRDRDLRLDRSRGRGRCRGRCRDRDVDGHRRGVGGGEHRPVEDGRRGRLLAVQDGGDPGDAAGDLDVALGAVELDGGEHGPHDVDHLQQHVGGGRGHRHLAVPQAREQVLTDVGDRLELAERQEAAGALDGVDRAEDAGEELALTRALLQVDQVAVELVEVLVALHEELLDDLVHRHSCSGSARPPERVESPRHRW